MRIAFAFFQQETNSFNPIPCGLELFEQSSWYVGNDIPEEHCSVGSTGGLFAAAEEEPGTVELVPIMFAMCISGGRVTDRVCQLFRDSLISGLKNALPLDGLFLFLHGAMAAETSDDVEGDILKAIREEIGYDLPIVVPADHHACITKDMIKYADVIVGHETQPHKFFETGRKAARILFDLIKGKISPVVSWRRIPMLAPQDRYLTSSGPMKEWFDLAREAEQDPRIICASNFPMQPWLDVAESGWASVVYADGAPALARDVADALSEKVWSQRHEFWESERVSVQEAVMLAEKAEQGLVVLSDTGDAVFGGSTGDSTCILREMLNQQITSTVFLPMIDPEGVEAAMNAGIGSRITVTLGGKRAGKFYDPIEVTGTVTGLCKELQVRIKDFGFSDLVRTARLDVGSIKIVLIRVPTYSICQPILYTHLGLNPDEAKAVVLKTGSNFQYFAQWQKQLIRVDSPGPTQSDLTTLTWQRAPRPIFPLDSLESWNASTDGEAESPETGD